MVLQCNKMGNLKLLIKGINGTIIKPREAFLFCKKVRLIIKKKWNFPLTKRNRELEISQSSNLMHWLAFQLLRISFN